MQISTSFGPFAFEFDQKRGNDGNYTHRNTIDPAIFQLIGDHQGLTIYDIACGNGYLARKFIKRGAREVWASDIAKELINIAEYSYDSAGIKFLVRNGSNFRGIPENYFDVVTINMGIFYIKDVSGLMQGIHRSLKQNGKLIFSLEHPLSHVGNKSLGLRLDITKVYRNYLREWVQIIPVDKTLQKGYPLPFNIFRRPLSYYLNFCSQKGFCIRTVIEPPTRSLNNQRSIRLNIPMYIIIEAIKK